MATGDSEACVSAAQTPQVLKHPVETVQKSDKPLRLVDLRAIRKRDARAADIVLRRAHDILADTFGRGDALDPLEVLEEAVNGDDKTHWSAHIVVGVAFDQYPVVANDSWTTDPPNEAQEALDECVARASSFEIASVSQCEYYPLSRSGLLSYMIVLKPHRGRGLSHRLIDCAVNLLADDFRSSCHVAEEEGVRPLFLETYERPHEESADTSMEHVRRRWRVLARLGFRRLDVEYVQPPLSEEAECLGQLYLCLHVRSRALECRDSVEASVVRNFLHELWQSCFEDHDKSFLKHPVYQRTVVEAFRNRKTVRLFPLDESAELSWPENKDLSDER